jgi:hypothetical protein
MTEPAACVRRCDRGQDMLDGGVEGFASARLGGPHARLRGEAGAQLVQDESRIVAHQLAEHAVGRLVQARSRALCPTPRAPRAGRTRAG